MKITLLIIPLILVAGCITPPTGERIPDGVYRATSGDESLTVNGDEIVINMRAFTSALYPAMYTRRYQYNIYRDERTGLRTLGFRPASSNSQFFVEGLAQYTWIWDGKTITRVREKRPANPEFPDSRIESYYIPKTVFKRVRPNE